MKVRTQTISPNPWGFSNSWSLTVIRSDVPNTTNLDHKYRCVRSLSASLFFEMNRSNLDPSSRTMQQLVAKFNQIEENCNKKILTELQDWKRNGSTGISIAHVTTKSEGLAALQLVSSSAAASPELRHSEPRISEHHHFTTKTAHTQTLESPVMLPGTPRQYSQRYMSVKYVSSRYFSKAFQDSEKFPSRAYSSSKHTGSKVLLFETAQNDLLLKYFSSKHPERFLANVRTPLEDS